MLDRYDIGWIYVAKRGKLTRQNSDQIIRTCEARNWSSATRSQLRAKCTLVAQTNVFRLDC